MTAAGLTVAGCLEGAGGGSALTIGATAPQSGRLSSLGQDMKRGYELGAQRMRENLDREVELIIKDDESDPKKVRSRLQQIVSNNDVNMLWGSFSSLLVTAGSNFAESEEIPFLGVAFAFMKPHQENDYRWTFAPFPKSRDVARSTKGLLELVPEGDRPSRIGIWEPNTGWGKEQATHWEGKLGDAGYDIVLRQKYQLGTDDFSTLISKSKNEDVEVLLSTPIPPGGITAVKQMKSAGFAPKLLKFVRAADPRAWWSALGQDGAYALMCPGWVPGMTGNGNEDMRQRYEAEYGLPDYGLLPVMVGGAYNLTQVAEQAVQAAGSLSAGDLQSALRSEKFQTVIGDFGMTKNGLPIEGQLPAPTGQWWKGAQHLVYPDMEGKGAVDLKFPLKPWGDR